MSLITLFKFLIFPEMVPFNPSLDTIIVPRIELDCNLSTNWFLKDLQSDSFLNL